MRRKRFVKLLMSKGMGKRLANEKAKRARMSREFRSYQSTYRGFETHTKSIFEHIRKEFEIMCNREIIFDNTGSMVLPNQEGVLEIRITLGQPLAMRVAKCEVNVPENTME